jgi:hypothetical protein
LICLLRVLGKQALPENALLQMLRLMHSGSAEYRPELGLPLLVRWLMILMIGFNYTRKTSHFLKELIRELLECSSPTHFFDLSEQRSHLFISQVDSAPSYGNPPHISFSSFNFLLLPVLPIAHM